MPYLKPVSLLTSQYLRKVGLPQAIPIGTGYTHRCEPKIQFIRPIHPDKVRLGFIPDNWFEFFYPKTGITGPYAFGVGVINFLLSKEIYVCDHEFYTGLALTILCVLMVKKLGPKTANYCDREIAKFEQNWQKQIAEELKVLQEMIEHEQLEQWRAEGSFMLMQAKKDNILLQLEAAYREELMKVYAEVKQRLDYNVACHHAVQRINHKHKMTWLMKNVLDHLPQDIDQQLLIKHKQDLSAMALNVK